MSSSLRRGALAASAIAFSIAPLSACAAGSNAQTLEVKPDNAATTVGDIKIQNAVVITQPDAASTGPAVVSATLFNTGTSDQTLDAISVEGDGSAEITPAEGKGKLTIPAGGYVVLGGKGNASAALADPGEEVADGNAQKVTFTFSRTGDVSLQAFVVPAESYFSTWGPTEIPGTPAAGSSPSATTSEEPSGDASAAESASASASASESESAAGH
ncbi:copper chaperone PCu(A)C [Streptomyces sp. HUCO-GS316]|uniref:copper chaperone PCu(A)C n=1 Tax=Streptomyces sp. HUCO-GS316 TaxID=2692198 RepID=UPI00136F1D68|nr:copper chaperone PCu(A)C [Streptomyces sp. HUCO-GS316]